MRENWIFCSRRRLCSRILKRRHFSSTLLSSSIRNFYIFICFCFLFIYFDSFSILISICFLVFFYSYACLFICLFETKKTNRKISGIESFPCKHMQIQKDADYPQQHRFIHQAGIISQPHSHSPTATAPPSWCVSLIFWHQFPYSMKFRGPRSIRRSRGEWGKRWDCRLWSQHIYPVYLYSIFIQYMNPIYLSSICLIWSKTTDTQCCKIVFAQDCVCTRLCLHKIAFAQDCVCTRLRLQGGNEQQESRARERMSCLQVQAKLLNIPNKSIKSIKSIISINSN